MKKMIFTVIVLLMISLVPMAYAVTEQQTLREVLDVARDWGPLWSCVALLIVFHIIQAWFIHKKGKKYSDADKKQDEEIEKLRLAKGHILDEMAKLRLGHEKELSETKERIANVRIGYEKQMADIRVELEKRTTFNWMEAKVLPKIEELTNTVAKFESTVELLVKQGLVK